MGSGETCPFGPNLIPIAKIDINGSYSQSPPPGSIEPAWNSEFRPLLANTIGYFTVKFAQPSMMSWSEINEPFFSSDGTWTTTMGSPPAPPPEGSKPGYNCVPEKTIHFVENATRHKGKQGKIHGSVRPSNKTI